MKSRSQRLPINDQPPQQPDDWVDGSWTVDCICGVNYDDGEEMVNCDECGVWVHTRCSRFVRGETSFACDKCKRKKNRNHRTSINDNEEETEVAQLLVELPTKTIATMNNNSSKSYMSSPAPARSSSLLLWTNIPPVEERVHVQGVPGGDPKLFQGVSAVFTPELWKCTGYVPKKFNFQYREFPCWEEEENGEKKKVEGNVGDEGSDNPVDSGADALFSLSKEIVSASPVEMLVGLRGSVEGGSREKNAAQKEGKNRGSEDSGGRYVHNGVGKESNQYRPSGVHLGKRKDSLRSKEFSGKKKARSASKDVEGKRRVPSSAISGEKVESLELGEAKTVATGLQDSKNKDKLTTLDHKTDNGSNANTYKPKDHLAVSAHYARDSSRKEKFKDGLAANVLYNKDLSNKANYRDNLEANAEDSCKKVKPKVSLEAKPYNADDSSKKGKSKDKLFAKPHHAEDLLKKVKSKDNLACNLYRGEDTSKETWGNSSLVEIVVKSENAHEDRSRNGSSSEAVTVEVSLLEPTGVNIVAKHEDLKSVGSLDHLNDGKQIPHDLSVNLSNCALPSSKLKSTVTEVPKNRVQDSTENTAPVSLRPDIKVKAEANEGLTKMTSSVASSLMVDVKLDDTKSLDQHPSISVSEHQCESLHVYGTDKSNIPSDDKKAIAESSAISCCIEDNIVEGMLPVSGEPCQNKEVIGSAGTLSVQECSSETKHLKSGEELSKTGGISPIIQTSHPQRKVVLGCGKSSSTVLISKSEVSGSCKPPGRPASPSTLRPIHFPKRVKTTSNADIMKDQTKANLNGDTIKDDIVVDTIKEDHRQDEPRKTGGEQLKASTISASKSSHMSRVSHASISKRCSTDSKEVVHYSYSKTPTAHNVTVCSGSIESINAMQSQSVSHVQSKTVASDFSEKGEKFSQSVCHPSSKVTSSLMHPPAPVNSSSTLSDEELALLLHQELNSSPRVPRVPRVRQPQLASTTTTNMLIKRASSSGVKDHIWVSRRKNKEEAPKDVSHSSGELSDEQKKTVRVLSNDHQRQDEVLTSDSSTKKEALCASPEAEHSAVKHTTLASTSTFGQSSSTEVIDQNLSSPRNSSRNTSDDEDDEDVDDEDVDVDDDDGGVAGPATRTLPGLLDEIMSKGQRMTYEELCNAVLPHWNNLRKHNGERYAYSSHSQAVLDCLRNRNEWARLVDRGPKTNAGRKKRRPESEPPPVEPEENEYSKSREKKELVGKKFDVHTEDFPKGKRKARKRRRLALQGRGIRDVRKRQKTNVVATDEDLGPFSHSSDDGGVFSEDGQVGRTTHPNGSEASTSSDEVDQ